MDGPRSCTPDNLIPSTHFTSINIINKLLSEGFMLVCQNQIVSLPFISCIDADEEDDDNADDVGWVRKGCVVWYPVLEQTDTEAKRGVNNRRIK